MTFHRTAGTGGTRNSARTKHIDEYAPNYNKSAGSGVNRVGRKQNNPPKKRKRSVGDRLADAFGARLIGKSKVTGRYDDDYKDSRYE